VLFGLIMTLSFTLGSGLTAADGPEGVRQLLIAALGCNVAWGIIDAVLCWMGRVSERNRLARLRASVRSAEDRTAAIALVRGELHGTLEDVMPAAAREQLYEAVVDETKAKGAVRGGPRREDLYAAAVVFLLVFVWTIPAALPFLFLSDKLVSLRASNAILIGLLFVTGWRWAAWTGGNRAATGAAMAGLGAALVAVAIALGG
jgi:VIT1/CCC1 family predicted Fe2+/Mn2+ transporter